MMRRRITIGIILILIFFLGYYIFGKAQTFRNTRPIQKAGILRSEMIKSLKNPFPQADTMVLDTAWAFCGNSSPEELPVIFDTHLGDKGYKNSLLKQINIPILSSEEFNGVMDTVLKYKFHNEYPASLWDTCRIGKVAADIIAEKISPKEVILHEYYLYNDKEKSISKMFTLENGKWAYKLIK